MKLKRILAVGTAMLGVSAFVPTPIVQKCVSLVFADESELTSGDFIYRVNKNTKYDWNTGESTTREYVSILRLADSAKGGDIVFPDEIDGLKVETIDFEGIVYGREDITSVTFPKYLVSAYNCFAIPQSVEIKISEGCENFKVEGDFLLGNEEFYDYSTYEDKTGLTIIRSLKPLSGEVTVPEGVVNPGSFAENHDITVINLPSTIQAIDWYFCSDMPSLKAINVAEDNDTYFSYHGALGKYYDVHYDENGNWLETPQKKKVILAVPEGYEGVFYVPDGEALTFTGISFENVSKMTGVELGKDTTFNCAGFQGCTSLENIELNGAVYSVSGIEKWYQWDYDNETKDWKQSDEPTAFNMTESMFGDTKWYKEQPDGVLYCGATILGYKGTPDKDKIDVKAGTRTIVDKAFNGLNIGEVNIPASVDYIGAYALDCPTLTAVNVDADNPNYTSVDGVVYDKAKTMMKLYPQAKTDETYTVPDGVSIIAVNAVTDNKYIKQMNFPASVGWVYGGGNNGGAFKDCTSLEKVVAPSGWTSFDTSPFYNCKLKTIDLSETVKEFHDGSDYEESNCTFDYLVFRNPDCSVYGMKNCTIVGLEGSNAQMFAQEHQLDFMLLDDYDKAQATATTTTATATTQTTTTTTTATTAASTSSTAQPSTTSTAASTTAQPTTTTTASTEVVTTTAAATVEIVEGTATVKGVYGGKTETHTCPFTYDYTPADGKDYIASIEFDVEISDKVKVSNKGMRTFTSSSGKKLVYLQFDVDAPVTPTEERIMYTITVTKATDVNGNDITASLPFLTKTEPLFIYATPDATTTEYTTTTEQSTTTTATTTAPEGGNGSSTTASASTTAPVSTTEPVTTTEPANADEPDMSAFYGSWISCKIENKGQPQDIPEAEAWQIVIAKDKTGRMVADEKAADLTWTPAENGKKMAITVDGDTADIALVGGELVLYVSEGKAMYFKHGELPVEFGDPNNDKKIDAKDASFVLLQYAKLSTGGEAALSEAEKAAADVNKDGKVDAKDASIVLAYYSHLSTGGELSLEDFMKSLEKFT